MNSSKCGCGCDARDVGLFILRVGLGACFIAHGWVKLHYGWMTRHTPESLWHSLGQAVSLVGVNSNFGAWGLAATLTEFCGGIALVFGFLVRPVAFALAVDMIVAIMYHLRMAPPPMNQFGAGWSHPLECGIVFLALLAAGGGTCSMDQKMFCKKPPTNIDNPSSAGPGNPRPPATPL